MAQIKKTLDRFGRDAAVKYDSEPAVAQFAKDDSTGYVYWRYFYSDPCAVTRLANGKTEVAWGAWNNRAALAYNCVNSGFVTDTNLYEKREAKLYQLLTDDGWSLEKTVTANWISSSSVRLVIINHVNGTQFNDTIDMDADPASLDDNAAELFVEPTTINSDVSAEELNEMPGTATYKTVLTQETLLFT